MSLVRHVRQTVKAVVHPPIAPFAIRSLRRKLAACPGLEQTLQLAETFDFGRIRINPVQVRAEITAFLEVLSGNPPRVVLEIGTEKGGTLLLFARVAAPDALLISVDLPEGYPAWRVGLYRSFARANQSIELLRADSHDPTTAAQVAARLEGRAADLLFIDGDHSEAGVRSDYELFSPLVAPGGIIAFHDIVPGPQTGGVPRFWGEIKARTGGREIVADWSQGGYGIGWFTVDAG